MITLGGLIGHCAVIAGLYFSITLDTGSPSTLELTLVAAPIVLIMFAWQACRGASIHRSGTAWHMHLVHYGRALHWHSGHRCEVWHAST